ncbi:iron-containing alcohol dehydrogenase [Enterocloster citroniae]|uniref:iron-containing alcohol dehydrogenase n=1 Tax=Enterocloster citroniae TaxID=358743 RepID=UPI0032BFED16
MEEHVKQFFMPRESLFGRGCSRKIGQYLSQRNLCSALVVTDTHLVECGVVNRVTVPLEEYGISFELFDQVSPNPTLTNVREGAEYYQKKGCDCIIAVGGGSPIDCGKAMGVWLGGKGELRDYIGLERCAKDSVPLIAVNTTAGTASEISRACLIIDESQGRKIAIKDKHAIPLLAVNDSELMVSLPPGLTASTGMDALTHAVESYTSTEAYPVTRASALEAVRLILEHLEKACSSPDSYEHRDNLIYAEFLAGISFCNSGLGLVHAMSHQLSATYGLAHGLCNAILLPYVMEFNRNICPGLYDNLWHRVSEKAPENCSEGMASEKMISHIRGMSERIGTARKLRELGVAQKEFSNMAQKALIDGCYRTTPVKADREMITTIYERAF